MPAGRPPRWIKHFRLRGPADAPPAAYDLFEDAFLAVSGGDAEDDVFNELVLLGSLSWREVALLRAFARYLRQVGTPFSQTYIARTLAAHPAIARRLVLVFYARLDPARGDDAAGVHVADRSTDILVDEIGAALDAIASLDEDRILRALLHLAVATLRTNWFQTDEAGHPRPCVVLKFDPAQVPDLPLPRPMFELFVYSPRVEGVHLRAGRVARVDPLVGLPRRLPHRSARPDEGAAGQKRGDRAVRRQRRFRRQTTARRRCRAAHRSGGLLSPLHRRTPRRDRQPRREQRRDVGGRGPRPSCTFRRRRPLSGRRRGQGHRAFSDIANEIACARSFWLGDAFASGGSEGYDHKTMGITARGAWESVRRHFRHVSIDPDRDDFTVVGIGDMSGDVFGNGMLLSHHIRLVAAFDYRHVFLDPDPDPETSWKDAYGCSSWRGRHGATTT